MHGNGNRLLLKKNRMQSDYACLLRKTIASMQASTEIRIFTFLSMWKCCCIPCEELQEVDVSILSQYLLFEYKKNKEKAKVIDEETKNNNDGETE